MRYRDLHIQTQRTAPNNARTEGFAFLVRAGYLTRESLPTSLGQFAIKHLRELSAQPDFLSRLSLAVLRSPEEIFFPMAAGPVELAHCPSCQYTERLELARFSKVPLPAEDLRPLERIATPNCHTIEALASFLKVPEEKTAKALMYTRLEDGQFIFVVLRGDMQLSEAKLAARVGEVRPATADEIERSGAVAGYASPMGLRGAWIIADDLIPLSPNLVAGANEAGYHLMNTNYGREYTASEVHDLAQASGGDLCSSCRTPLSVISALPLATRNSFYIENVLLALAEAHRDPKGLTLPHPVAPFDVYLLHLPGREIDTQARAVEVYNRLQTAGVSVLFDDRDERAGVKFNDADLIGCPLRVTVGEKALAEGMVEFKPRLAEETRRIPLEEIARIMQDLQA